MAGQHPVRLCSPEVMSNYDYNKGYRWFRFKKDSSIDPSLPPLSSYRSARETKPLLIVSNEAEQVITNETIHVHHGITCRQTNVCSVHLPLILSASLAGTSLSPSPRPEEKDVVATAATRNYLTNAGNHSKAVKSNSGFKTPRASNYIKRVARKGGPKKGAQHVNINRNLKDCLFIQNGIERFPASQDGFLTEEKARDIREWMDKMADDS